MKLNIKPHTLAFTIALSTTPLLANESLPEINNLIGTWQTHHAQTFLTISIEADKTAVVYWDWNGSHSCYRTKWEKKKNGLLVEGFPRFRIWQSDNVNRPSMQMEPIDPKLTTEEMTKFPTRHVMSKIETFVLPEQMKNRPLPQGWESEISPKENDR